MTQRSLTLFKTTLYIISCLDSVRPPDSNTRLQYTNSQILLRNRRVLQQQHVDGKIAVALLKMGTKQHADGWDAPSKAWAHMVLHLPHAEGGYGVTSNDITKDAAFYTATSRFVAWLGAFSQERKGFWLPKDDLRNSSSWSSPPLLLLRHIHSKASYTVRLQGGLCAVSVTGQCWG